jgi:hypothetical protein
VVAIIISYLWATIGAVTTTGATWWVSAQWKFGLSYGYADLDKYDLRGNTRMLLARLQWMY